MPSLYELTQGVQQLQDLLELGEIDDQVFRDTLDAMDIETKVENICKVLKNLQAQADMYKAEKDRLAERQKTAENGVKRLKDSLLAYMQVTNHKKVQAGVFTVSKSSRQSVEVLYEDMLPDEFLIPQPAKVDKTAITKALKAGEAVAGAEFVTNEFVTIR